MRRLIKKFEKAMEAIAFAEAGEFETAREILKEKRKILLALRGGASDSNAFKYAVNSCKRIGAELEILSVVSIDNGVLRKFKSELRKEGIEFFLVKKSGSLEEAIRNYTSLNSDILFVAVEVAEDFDIYSRKAERIINDAWKNLKCPLVVIARGQNAFAA